MSTTYDMNTLQPVQTSVARLPVPADEDMPVVTVQGRFDWKFWAGLAVGAYALFLLAQSMKRAARHG
jgi:hypothetical protein